MGVRWAAAAFLFRTSTAVNIPKIIEQHHAGRPTISADGQTVSNDGKTLQVATKDGRLLTLKLNDATKYTHSGSAIPANKIIPHTTVHVDASEDSEANLTATAVDLVKDAPVETKTADGHDNQTNGAAGPHAVNPDGTTPDAEDAELTRPTILNGPSSQPTHSSSRQAHPPRDRSHDDMPGTSRGNGHGW